MNAEPWVTTAQVARPLGAVKGNVYRRWEREGLPAYKISRRWKFLRSEIDDWMHAGGRDENRQSRDSSMRARAVHTLVLGG